MAYPRPFRRTNSFSEPLMYVRRARALAERYSIDEADPRLTDATPQPPEWSELLGRLK